MLGVVGAILIIIILINIGVPDKISLQDDDGAIVADTVPALPVMRYGLYADSFNIVHGKIKPNEFLADILLKHHVSYPEIDKLVKSTKDQFNLRNLVAGKKYEIFCSKDSTEAGQYFVYMPNAIDYVVFELKQDYTVRKEKRPVIVNERSISGVINSSMYQTLADLHASPAIAVRLSEIYAWTIDFYRIQKGDYFKVIFEENFVEGERVGIGKIKMAQFNHGDNDFYAFRFEQKGVVDYFDEKAKSLRKAFLKAPVKFSRISSRYSTKRYHPIQKRWKGHYGTDYAAPKGTPIVAVGDGKIVEARYNKSNGNFVKIRHNGTYTTQYLHMTKIAKGMKPGKMVKQSDVIGYVGSTGLATGPHVCFRFWKNGRQVDHLRQKFPASKPVKPANMKTYMAIVRQSINRLNEVVAVPETMPAELLSAK